ncbi:helix-turn-helix domain-containing protein [Phytohabitans flavus]|uniref:helix-turn-helix domain-containing protein n=1 Tax=Phytohabitans flavus TaxID=1076124 RepID=UPI00363738B8
MIDRAGLAEFLRRRREWLQPEDVGLPRGQRRRTDGLRREEAASLCHMSTDYYARLERKRGPYPSEKMIASIVVRGLDDQPPGLDAYASAGHADVDGAGGRLDDAVVADYWRVPGPEVLTEEAEPGLERHHRCVADIHADLFGSLGHYLQPFPCLGLRAGQ